MGYYILGIIIFLLMIVFISDLIRNSRNRDEDDDLYYDQYTNRFYTNEFGTEFHDDDLEKELSFEESKTNDMGVEPIHQNLEHQAFETEISEEDHKLENELPKDPDEDSQLR